MKKLLAAMLIALSALSAAYAAKAPKSMIQNYSVLSLGADFGWSVEKREIGGGVTASRTVRTNYITLRADGVNYFGDYVGVNYGIGMNIPLSMYEGDQKTEDFAEIMPVEFAIRAALVGRYPVSRAFAVGGRIGVAVNGGLMESSNSITDVKNMTERADITLGALCEFAVSEAFGLTAGFDVMFPVTAFQEVTTTVKGSSPVTVKSRPDYRRYGFAPYVGVIYAY